jgi:hypothetical protein
LNQSQKIEDLTIKLEEITAKANLTGKQLGTATEQLNDLQQYLDDTKEGKKLIERELKFGHEEIASRDADIDELKSQLAKKQRDLELIFSKNEELQGQVKLYLLIERLMI